MQKIIDKLKTLEGKNILLGLSGGVDSSVLFHLACLANIDFTCVHINHELRPEAPEDEIFCSELAIKADKKIKVVRIDIREYAKLQKLSLEDAGRKARILTFQKFNPDVILLAHHADDQVETVLMNIARGAGIHGKAGMREWNGKVFRPMLDIWKKEITAYAKKNLLEWREDSTNQDLDFTRNKFRHEIIPNSEKKHPNFKAEVLAISKQARIESDNILKTSAEWLQDRREGFSRTDFQKNSPELQGEILRTWWILLHGTIQGFERVRATEIINLIEKNIGEKKVKFGNFWVKIKRGQISVSPYTQQ